MDYATDPSLYVWTWKIHWLWSLPTLLQSNLFHLSDRLSGYGFSASQFFRWSNTSKAQHIFKDFFVGTMDMQQHKQHTNSHSFCWRIFFGTFCWRNPNRPTTLLHSYLVVSPFGKKTPHEITCAQKSWPQKICHRSAKHLNPHRSSQLCCFSNPILAAKSTNSNAIHLSSPLKLLETQPTT